MSIDQTLERIDKLGETLARFEKLIDKVPRLLEMFGVGYFAGKAAENVGSDFQTGAIAGIVADGLAHSQLPNNQIGGLALAGYFSLIGLLNILPFGPPNDPFEPADPKELPAGIQQFVVTPTNYPQPDPNVRLMPVSDCLRSGGEVVQAIPNTILCQCRLPTPATPPPSSGTTPSPRPIHGPRR